MQCKFQVEINPWCRRVLAKHWPHVRRFEDVKTFALEEENSTLKVDVIAGGFPCQDISDAGKKAGIAGERSGLWSEFARIIRRLRPRYVVVENVAALLKRGMETVLADLARMRYDAEWRVLSAGQLGFPHQRKRLFILAYAAGERRPTFKDFPKGAPRWDGEEQAGWRRQRPRVREFADANPDRIRLLPVDFDGRVDDGIPHRLDRIRGLGNSVIPAIAQYVGERIIEASKQGK